MNSQLNTELRARARSFGYAFAGWAYVVRYERNAWIHALATVAVVALGAWLGVGRLEWALLTAAIAAVWLGECFNTAVEALVDLTSPEPHPLAKVAKDTAAAGVLLAAIGAAVIGFLVLGPPLLARLGIP